MFDHIERSMEENMSGIRSLERAIRESQRDRLAVIKAYARRSTRLFQLAGEDGVSAASSMVHTFLFENLSNAPYSFSTFHAQQSAVVLEIAFGDISKNQRLRTDLWATARDDLTTTHMFFHKAIDDCMQDPGYLPGHDGRRVTIPTERREEFASNVAVVVSYALLGDVF